MFRQSENLKFVSSREVHIEDISKETRPILEVEFNFNQTQSLYVYLNHWPSQRNPSNDRKQAATVLRKLIEERRAEKPDALIIAFGDFNTKKKERGRHPFREILLKSHVRLIDVHKVVDPNLRKNRALAKGTYYYRNRWQLLDRFFVSENLQEKVNLPSYDIFNHPDISRTQRRGDKITKIPWRYNHYALPGEAAGFSDHYAIYLEINPNSR